MINHEIRIRDAVPEDAAEIARIWLDGLEISAGLPGPPIGEAAVAFELRIREPLGQSGIWVAEVDGVLAGWQGLQDFGVTQISRIGQSSTYIAQQWHGRGIGRQLLRHAQDEARERGLSLIVGFVRTDNDTSVKLVDALGWKCVGILPRDSASDPELAYYAYAVPRNRNELNEKVDCPIQLAAMVAANKDGFR